MTFDSSRRDAESQRRALRLGPIVAVLAVVFGVTALLSFDFNGPASTPDFGLRLLPAGWAAMGLVALYLLTVLIRRRATPPA